MSRIFIIALVAATAFAGFAAPLFAGDDHQHGAGKVHVHDKKDENAGHGVEHGGQFVETADHHGVEMVLKGTSLVFHMTKDHDPLDVTGSQFKAIIQTGASTTMVELAADGTRLTATLDAPLPKGTKIAITGKAPYGAIIQARFVIE